MVKSNSNSPNSNSQYPRRDFILGGAAALALGLIGKTTADAIPEKQSRLSDHTRISENAGSEKKNLSHFDVALYPQDDAFRKECIRLARTNLSERADGYLLAEDAFPHVTLTLFQSDEDHLAEIWKNVSALQTKPLELKFTHVYIDPDMNTHGLLWVGLAVRPQAELVQLQHSVFENLNHMGIVGRTKPETYFPHITWARCRDTLPFTLKELPSVELYQKTYSFEITIGRSNENGVYRERIYH